MFARILLLTILGLFGCAESAPPSLHSTASRQQTSAPAPGSTIVFYGMCDASGAVALSDRTFLVADDEDNVLRLYDAERGGAPLWSKDVSADLALSDKPKKKSPEMDIEAAARVGDVALWLTSFGRNRTGKLKPERFRLFATRMTSEGSDLDVLGYTSTSLLDALLADPRYASFGLDVASELAPKTPGALNIEGMTARSEGGVWIGFRNPNPGSRALLAPLFNPIEMTQGAPAQLGDPLLLDLGGFGVRGLSSWHGRYLIVAGPYDTGQASRLYEWDGGTSATPFSAAHLEGFNPEGFFTPENREEIMLLSDDGSQLVEGIECKKQKDPAKKHFRGVWLRL